MNTRVMQAVTMCIVVVLAGCTGLGGLGAGDDGEAAASNPELAGERTTESAGSTANAASASGGTTASDDASDEPSTGDGSSDSTAPNAEGEWFNLSKPGRYVFEIESAEEGVGTMAFETAVSNGEATVNVEYELGGESFESTVTGPVGEVEPQIAASPAYAYLVFVQIGGFGAGPVGGEELGVGDEFSQQSAEGSTLVEVVGTDSYAGVECYAVETRLNGTLTQEVCTQAAFSSAPYVAIYDEDGDLTERVELVEHRRE